MNMQVLDARRDVSGGYKVDVSRGQRIGRVSSEWFSRPDDERFLSLGDLARSVRGRSERSRTRVVESALIHVEANRNDPERLVTMSRSRSTIPCFCSRCAPTSSRIRTANAAIDTPIADIEEASAAPPLASSRPLGGLFAPVSGSRSQ